MEFLTLAAESMPLLVADDLYGCLPVHLHMANALPTRHDAPAWEPWLLPAYVITCCGHGRRMLYSFN